MASPTQWTWVWANSGRWWRTGKPGMLQSMGSQRVGHNWATKQQQIIWFYGYFNLILKLKNLASKVLCSLPSCIARTKSRIQNSVFQAQAFTYISSELNSTAAIFIKFHFTRVHCNHKCPSLCHTNDTPFCHQRECPSYNLFHYTILHNC